ncbi:MAG: AraC family transcriptional regulator [Acidobacteriota bacterium]|nr:AraC family transcriptional regulator [Acidobacteriota bacterium]
MRTYLKLPRELDGSIWLYRNTGATHRRHHHAELELNLVTHGEGTYLVRGRRYQLRRGDLIWLFPAQEHLLLEQSQDFAMWIGVFRRKVVRTAPRTASCAVLLQRDPAGEFCRRLLQQDARRADLLFQELAVAAPYLRNAGLPYALLTCWQYFERAGDIEVADLHPAVERAARILSQAPETVSLRSVAASAGISAARLSRLFRAQTGVAMVEFRNRKRIERFLELYGAGHRRTMLDAALEAGFGSYPQFHRIFRRTMGYAPMQYRQRRSEGPYA